MSTNEDDDLVGGIIKIIIRYVLLYLILFLPLVRDYFKMERKALS